jgi:pilus assembly protein CpaB
VALQKLNKNILLIAVAMALGGGAIYLSNRVISDKINAIESEARRGKKMVKVVVPTHDLEKGEALTAESVAIREVPQDFVSHLSITPENFETIENERLAVPVKRGEALLQVHTEGSGARVFSASLRKGSRALTFEVDDVNSISGMLRPGDRIDLILTAKGGSSSSDTPDITFPMLSDVIVLATGQTVSKKSDQDGQEHTFSTITLELNPEDAHRIIVAKASGKLTAVLRNPDDRERNKTLPLTINDVVAGKGSVGHGRTIDYLIGGGGAPTAMATVAMATKPKTADQRSAFTPRVPAQSSPVITETEPKQSSNKTPPAVAISPPKDPVIQRP